MKMNVLIALFGVTSAIKINMAPTTSTTTSTSTTPSTASTGATYDTTTGAPYDTTTGATYDTTTGPATGTAGPGECRPQATTTAPADSGLCSPMTTAVDCSALPECFWVSGPDGYNTTTGATTATGGYDTTTGPAAGTAGSGANNNGMISPMCATVNI